MEGMVPLLVAVSGLPAVGMAAWLARSPLPQRQALALHMALVGIAIFAGALGLYWAGADAGRVRAVAAVLLVVVNLLGVSLLLRMRRDGAGRRRRP
jgi:thiol:disulfide interchange protein